MHPRTIQGKKVYVGDKLKTAGDLYSGSSAVVSKIDVKTGLVQYRGDTYHWYSTEQKRHVYEDEV